MKKFKAQLIPFTKDDIKINEKPDQSGNSFFNWLLGKILTTDIQVAIVNWILNKYLNDVNIIAETAINKNINLFYPLEFPIQVGNMEMFFNTGLVEKPRILGNKKESLRLLL